VDNFEFPRWCLDVTFLRLYEDGQLASTPTYLPMTTAVVEEDDVVFVAGHPGRTQRLYTADHLRYLRDVAYPKRMDITRAREALGWSPTVTLEEGLAQTIADFRQRLGL